MLFRSIVVINYLYHGTWFLGLFLLGMGVLFGAVGQTVVKKVQGMERNWGAEELSHEESYALASAVVRISLIVAATVAVLSFHRGSRWYASLLLAWGAWFVSVIGSFALIFLPAVKLLPRAWSKR